MRNFTKCMSKFHMYSNFAIGNALYSRKNYTAGKKFTQLTNFKSVLKNTAKYWIILKFTEKYCCWQEVKSYNKSWDWEQGHSWMILKNTKKYWKILKYTEIYWKILQNTESYWNILKNTAADRRWRVTIRDEIGSRGIPMGDFKS